MPELTALAWIVVAAGALIIGLAKTALPGAGTVAAAAFAAVLPAKQSTGTILLLLIVGDMFALWMYRQHADWRSLIRLAPAVIVGLLVGVAFMAFADDDWVRRVIGVILLAVVAVTLWRRRARPDAVRSGRVAAAAYGSLGGFTTMVANAAGPVMSMYFLASRFEVKAFLGTAAWFFAIINITKVPFSAGLGLITPQGLLIDAVLVPLVVIGAFGGRAIASRVPQRLFDRLVIAFTIAGALYLLLPVH
ncbi:sulfite exporter TauE/SafE family protein [Microbacterium dauci]|uniref:Probable membrane transporter protein n=1 Tax=Microbacterium dauci TaxID=3048008 RepID=A0ABT6ZDV0_9MICO|nr:sulfite exporter TauE/SafE family protein [Microbacterium sp. LX3-4]MDJ1114337.1 sulfite exporter TauE/SafE family protein [Microbacterium sp. LX3-4]